jgi:hypothetical protein
VAALAAETCRHAQIKYSYLLLKILLCLDVNIYVLLYCHTTGCPPLSLCFIITYQTFVSPNYTKYRLPTDAFQCLSRHNRWIVWNTKRYINLSMPRNRSYFTAIFAGFKIRESCRPLLSVSVLPVYGSYKHPPPCFHLRPPSSFVRETVERTCRCKSSQILLIYFGTQGVQKQLQRTLSLAVALNSLHGFPIVFQLPPLPLSSSFLW